MQIERLPATVLQKVRTPVSAGPRPTPGGVARRPYLRRVLITTSPTTWASLDAVVIALATSAAQALLVSSGHNFGWAADPWLATTAFCACIVAGGLVFGLYERRTLLSRSSILCRALLSLGLGVVLAFACVSLFFYAWASRWMVLAVALVFLAVSVPLRLLAHEVITTSRMRLLCVGGGDALLQLVRVLRGRVHQNYEIVGHVTSEDTPRRARRGLRVASGFCSEQDAEYATACPQLGHVDGVSEIIVRHQIDEVVVAPELMEQAAVGRAVSACLESRCRITDQTTFVEKLLGEVPADTISADWFLKADVQNHSSYEAGKRLIDVLVAGFGLLVSLPLWPLIILAIRLDSPGAAIYRQIRVGQYGRCFRMLKFRTMRTDAERDGVRWAGVNDSRVTRIGRFLRNSRLDELPQLLNILRGDMSLVGPRPERPEFVHNLEQVLPHYRLRHLIKPGLTGWAQIHYGYGASVEDTHRKLCYDLYYLKHRSLDLDVGVLIRTVGTFLLGAR